MIRRSTIYSDRFLYSSNLLIPIRLNFLSLDNLHLVTLPDCIKYTCYQIFYSGEYYLKILERRLVVQNLKMAWSRRFIPKLFVWHSSRDIVRMKWRYCWAGLYTEKKRSHWLKQWPIRKGLGDKKRRVVIGWKCNLDLVGTLEQSTNGNFKRL